VVIQRASEVLDMLEKDGKSGTHKSLANDLPLFSAVQASPPSGPGKVEKRLAGASPDELSPREALALLYELKELLGEKR